MRKILVISLGLTLILHACASTGFLMAKAKVNLYQEAYPQKDENAHIDIYKTQKPDKKYVEFAEITCNDTNDNWALQQTLIKAREIGADGIIIIGKSGSYGYGVPVGNVVVATSESYGIKAIAIKYIDE